MDERTRGNLKLLGANLAFVVAGIHLLLGIRLWLIYSQGGFVIPPDVRAPLWIVSAIAIFAGLGLVYTGIAPRLLYSLGAALMAVYVLGYFSWHLGGHREFYFGGPMHLHGVDVTTFLIDHLFAGPLETSSIFLEVILFVILVVLLVDES